MNDVVYSLGLTNLEALVLAGIGIAIFGVVFVIFWKYIIAGALVLFCVVVLANHKFADPVKEVETVAKKEVIVETIIEKSKEDSFMTEPKDDKKFFMEDCLNLTDYTKKQCENIWFGRENNNIIIEGDSQNSKLLNVDNVEYKNRRAEVLKKSNSILLHATYR
jgi:hypothetical protein